MKRTTLAWLLNKWKRALVKRVAPLGIMEVDGLKFHYLREESPPQNPAEFRLRGEEFHGRLQRLSGDVAVDVGANIGSYTLHLARKFKTVIAFEPSEDHARVLRLNLKANNLRNVRVEQVALSDKNGQMPLYFRPGGGATSLDPEHYGLRYNRVRLVKVARLNDFIEDLEGLDFVKIDAENSELSILKGGQDALARFRPLLAVEVHTVSVPSECTCGCETCQFISGLGYRVEVTGGNASLGGVHWVWATPETNP